MCYHLLLAYNTTRGEPEGFANRDGRDAFYLPRAKALAPAGGMTGSHLILILCVFGIFFTQKVIAYVTSPLNDNVTLSPTPLIGVQLDMIIATASPLFNLRVVGTVMCVL